MSRILKHELHIRAWESADLPTAAGDFKFAAVMDSQGLEHAVLYSKQLVDNPYVRIHSSCLTGDIFFSRRCDCGAQLQLSLDIINRNGGVIIYLKQEGRGIGLVNKIKAYNMQSEGLDTVQANLELGFAADCRDYIVAASICHKLGINDINLISNNPDKVQQLLRYGIRCCKTIDASTKVHKQNSQYMQTKITKFAHTLNLNKEVINV